jgi:predicted nucleic acid-binding protein
VIKDYSRGLIMTRVLLDTNVVIHRENDKASNYSIGHLYRWLDKLKYDKIIHQYTIDEISKYEDEERQESLSIKFNAYDIIKTIKTPTKDFLSVVGKNDDTPNDKIDNCLIFEVYSNRVDILITEDKNMLIKAKLLGIRQKVFSINEFIAFSTAQYPQLIEYKMLAVKKEYFGNIDANSHFFDGFKRDYKEFSKWFSKKCDDEAYICKNDMGDLLGFLYIKPEDEKESYGDITPVLSPKKRLKIGTFKIESTGFRLGERFIKIIFDNAIQYNVDEIYVTMFEGRKELSALSDLISRWGFCKHGIKHTDNGDETVFVKRMKIYNSALSVKANYPNILYDKQKFVLPILPQYHTTLLPDSKLNTENEIDFLGMQPHRYALEKVYISFSFERNIRAGDIIVFYRPGLTRNRKKYESVLTTIGIVDNIFCEFSSKDDFFRHCQNRTVFSTNELNDFWNKKRESLLVVKFIFVKSLHTRLTLEFLWNENIIPAPNGPRPFTKITDGQFDKILTESKTNINFIK